MWLTRSEPNCDWLDPPHIEVGSTMIKSLVPPIHKKLREGTYYRDREGFYAALEAVIREHLDKCERDPPCPRIS